MSTSEDRSVRIKNQLITAHPEQDWGGNFGRNVRVSAIFAFD